MLRPVRTPVQQTGYCKQDVERGQPGLILALSEDPNKHPSLSGADGLTALGRALLLVSV